MKFSLFCRILCGYFCKLVNLLCLPPCPRYIIQKSVFRPPPPTYSVVKSESDPDTYQLSVGYNSNYWPVRVGGGAHVSQFKHVRVHFTTNKYGNKIACLYYNVNSHSKTTILYSHGNGSDLGFIVGLCMWIAKEVQCNILAYDYSGYGLSSGKPSEKRMYKDVEAAYQLLVDKYQCSPEDIILYGQSLGSAPTIHLASKLKVKGVIIQSGFASALNVAFSTKHPKSMCCDVFENIKKIDKVTSPTLVIHGMDDEMINVRQGIALYEKCQTAVRPLWLAGANHNDVEMFREFMDRLKAFVKHELFLSPRNQTSPSSTSYTITMSMEAINQASQENL